MSEELDLESLLWDGDVSDDTGPGYVESKDVYPDEFIARLAKDFEFDAFGTHNLTRLYEIPYRYKLMNDLVAGDREREKSHLRHVRMLKALNTFRDVLEAEGGHDFNMEVARGAVLSGDLDPQLDPADYPDKNLSARGCYWFEFDRYLTFFERGLADSIERLKSKAGRYKNEGLSLAISNIANFWEYDLGRKFTFDAYEGQGITDAYDFTKALLEPVDDIPDEQIKTAMRREIKERRAFKENH